MALTGSLNGTVPFTDSTGTTLVRRVNGQLLNSIDDGQNWYGPSVSGEEQDMFKARMQAFAPPGFGAIWCDFFYAQYDLFNLSAATFTAAAVSTGRSGVGKKIITTSGAGGFYYDTLVATIAGPTIAIIAADICNDFWYTGCGGIVNVAPTGNAEIGICGLYNEFGGNFAATDGAGPQYVTLGVSLAVSATNLVVRRWDGSALLTSVTAIPIEVGVFRRWEMCNDGMGTIWILRDGVVMDSITDLNFLTFIPHVVGGYVHYHRANGGTTSFTWDWIGAGGQRT